MPLNLEHTKDDLTCPQLQCDSCGELITDARQAIVAWHEDDYHRRISHPVILHKGRCDNDKLECSMEMSSMIAYLWHNLKMQRKTAQ